MSVDLELDQVCPHEVTGEALYVSSDRQTVRPLRPISSAGSVKLRLNGSIDVPSYGHLLPAKVLGTRRGPFTVSKGVNDVLELIVNQRVTTQIVLPAGSKLTAPQLAGHCNRRVDGVRFSVVNNTLVITSNDDGPAASIFVTSATTAASVLGFTVNHEYRGQQTVPGWSLVSDLGSLADRPVRLVVFDQPLRGGSDFVEISYATMREECRRCGGVGLENDWRYDLHGAAVLVTDEDLLRQELQKIFFTMGGSNPFHTWYGTGLIEAIGTKLAAGGLTRNLIVSDIYQAFSRWQAIKRQQEEAGIEVTDREYPFRLSSVNVQDDPQDPTIIYVSIEVQNRSTEAVSLTRGFRLPAGLQLDGSGARQSLSNFVLTG